MCTLLQCSIQPLTYTPPQLACTLLDFAFLNSQRMSAMYLLSSSSTCSSWGISVVVEDALGAMKRRHSNSVKVL